MSVIHCGLAWFSAGFAGGLKFENGRWFPIDLRIIKKLEAPSCQGL